MFHWQKITIRTRIGLLAIAFWIATAVGFWHYRVTGHDEGLGVGNRFGVIMSLLWLAWPELSVLPAWCFYLLPVLIVLGVWRPILLVYAIPLLLIYQMVSFVFCSPKTKENGKD